MFRSLIGQMSPDSGKTMGSKVVRNAVRDPQKRESVIVGRSRCRFPWIGKQTMKRNVTYDPSRNPGVVEVRVLVKLEAPLCAVSLRLGGPHGADLNPPAPK